MGSQHTAVEHPYSPGSPRPPPLPTHTISHLADTHRGGEAPVVLCSLEEVVGVAVQACQVGGGCQGGPQGSHHRTQEQQQLSGICRGAGLLLQ